MDIWPFKIAGASRPHPNEQENGDAWHVLRHGNVCRLCVIDGLGHGPEAAKATHVAIAALEGICSESPSRAIQQCHAALRGTRGVVMAVADIDLESQTLNFASIGNIDGIVEQDGKTHRLISYRGIVGSTLPTVRSFDFALTGHWSLLLHSDGIMSRFDPATELEDVADPESWALAFLQRWARDTDDATVVLVTNR